MLKNETEKDFEFLMNNTSEYIPFIILHSLGSIFGTFGSGAIIAAIIVTKELRDNTNLIIGNIAIANFFLSSLVDPLLIAGVFKGHTLYENVFGSCSVVGAICFVTCNTASINMLILSINRYVNICYNQFESTIFSEVNTKMYCILSWIILITVGLVLMFFELFDYDDRLRACLFDYSYNSYLINFLAITILIPFFLIAYFYLKIFSHTFEAKERARSLEQVQKEKNDLKFSIGLFSSFLFHLLAFIPFAFILMIDNQKNTLPVAYHLYSLVLMRCNSCLNPIIYSLANTIFRKGFRNIYFLLFNRKEYSFSITEKEKRLLNERRQFNEIEFNRLNSLKKDENLKELENLTEESGKEERGVVNFGRVERFYNLELDKIRYADDGESV